MNDRRQADDDSDLVDPKIVRPASLLPATSIRGGGPSIESFILASAGRALIRRIKRRLCKRRETDLDD